jgi:membrane associated rhomboid family serine protease
VLVIPIGQEENVVRRHPWVSYGIVCLNVLVFVAVDLFGGAAARGLAVQRAASAAVEMLARHPYLTVPVALLPALPEETMLALGRARERAQRRHLVPAPGQVAEEQGKLDALAATFQEQYLALPTQRLGYVPARPRAHALLTSLFMHAGWLHLLGNMLFFFLSGPFIEDVYGRPLFAGFYLAGGVVATLTHAAAEGQSQAALVGASGAIAAVMGAFLVRYGSRRIAFLLLPIPILPMIRTRFFMPAFVVLPFWFGQQLLFAHSDVASGTAWWAHIGGFAFGLAFALVLRATRAEQRVIDPGIRRQVEIVAHPALEQIVDARVEGRFEEARRLLDDVLKSEPGNLDAWTEAYELALARSDAAAAGRAMIRLLDLYGKAQEDGLAEQLVRDPRWRELGPLPPQAYLSVAGWLEKEGDAREALELYAEVARVAPADPKALRALVRRGQILHEGGNHREARLAFARAREHPAYGGTWQATVEAALSAMPAPVVPVDPDVQGEVDG